jgi:hypothetical protein
MFKKRWVITLLTAQINMKSQKLNFFLEEVNTLIRDEYEQR